MAEFVTQRGVVQTTRPYADISDEEATEILLDNIHFGGKYCMKQYNISKQTLHHLKWHRSEKLLAGINIHKPRGIGVEIKKLKDEGLNSLQVAERLQISLAEVNVVWPTLE